MRYPLPAFLNSSHISARTRAILVHRIEQEHGQREHLSPQAFHILEYVCDDILPQAPLLGKIHLNLAVMIDHTFAGPGDGWRFADLPADLEAWEAGLRSLDIYSHTLFHQPYTSLTSEEKGHILDRAFQGHLPSCPDAPLSPAQMALWSGDLREMIVGAFLAHPLAQEQLGISANFTGGDKEIQGFSEKDLSQKAPFEPVYERRFYKNIK